MVTHSLSDTEFLELQEAQLQSVLQRLLLQFHDPSVMGHILYHCGGAVRTYNTRKHPLMKSRFKMTAENIHV